MNIDTETAVSVDQLDKDTLTNPAAYFSHELSALFVFADGVLEGELPTAANDDAYDNLYPGL